ncbi:MAG: fibronectin type III domain-containing protein, partial [Gemmatimonadota bacterium]
MVLRVLMGLAVVVGCEEVLVSPVPVATIEIVPDNAELFVGQSVQLEAELRDDTGELLGGRHVTWRSDDAGMADVDTAGRVEAVGAGTTEVTATAEGQTGYASIVVLRLPRIELDRGSVAFSAVAGSGDPQPVEVGVTNGGDGALEALGLAVTYGDTVGGWLDAALDSTGAPTHLTLTARTAGLEPGPYAATVNVTDPEAENAPVGLDVTFQVQHSIPVAPSALTADVSADTVVLAWADNSDNETEFRLERQDPGETSFALLATPAADSAGYRDTTVVLDGHYRYRVRACNDSGCSPSSDPVDATTPPVAPAELTVVSATTERIQLTWADNSATETRFELERSVNAAAFAALENVPGDTVAWADTTVTEDTEYAYRVRACNGGGCSEYTGEVAVTTLPAPPSRLSAAPASDTAVDLAWADNSDTETGFRIERSTDGGSTFTELITVGADVTSYTDTGLAPSTTYSYRVLACNASGCSEPTSAAETATSSIPAPSDLAAIVVSVTQIDLSWTDNSATETQFRIERSTDGGTTFTALDSVDADVTAYSDSTTAEDTRYTYRVAACDGSSCSPFSSRVTRTTRPSAASDLTAAAASDTEIDLAWTDNSTYETEFGVQRSTDGGTTFSDLTTLAANTTTYTDDGLSPATTYAYRVLTCNASGCADPTAAASATTDAIPAPSDLAATVVSAGRIDLGWTDNSTTETRFLVERSADGGTSYDTLAILGANATTYSDESTVEDTEYGYRVAACNGDGCSAWSGTAEAITPPSAASGLELTVISATQIDLAWTDNAATATEFRIQRSVSGGSFNELDVVGADVATYSDTTTMEDTEYAYRVVACNASGCAASSNIASRPTPPTVPGDLDASAVSDTRIDLSWTDNSATEDSFRIERRTGTGDFASVTTTGADVTSYSITGLSPSTAYDYRIQACNAGGCSAYTDTVTATTLDMPPPADPTDLTATLAGDQSSTALNWTDNATDEDQYRVRRSVDGGTFTVRATLGENTTTFTDNDMSVDDQYTYRVEACNDAGCSGFSNEASVVTEPVAASGLAVTVIAAGQIDLSWTDESDTEDVFRIERSTDGGAFTVLDSVPTDSTAFLDLTTVEDTEYTYRIQACNTTGCSAYSAQAAATTPPSAASGLAATAVSDTEIDLAWTDNSDTETEFLVQRQFGTSGGYSTIDTLAAGATSYTDSDLTAETTYEYRIVACNASGCADPSTSATATTQPIPVPSAPSDLSVTSVTTSQIELGWSDNSTTETRFEVERSTDDGEFDALTPAGADATTYTDGAVAEDTEYAYRVRACNDGGCSAWAGPAATTTPPTAASDLTATAPSDTEITLSWTDNSDTETGFRVERSPDGAGTFAEVTTTGPDVTDYTDTGLEPTTTYDYRVVAFNDAGDAAPTPVASATTQPIPVPSAPSDLSVT